MIVQLNSDIQQADFVIIEFQGEVCGELKGILGNMRIKRRLGAIDIQLGDCLIGGKIVSLEKPLMVIEKVDGKIKIIGFVRTKFIFNGRPEYVNGEILSKVECKANGALIL